MLEDSIGGTHWRPGYNPEFVKRAKANNARRAAERRRQQVQAEREAAKKAAVEAGKRIQRQEAIAPIEAASQYRELPVAGERVPVLDIIANTAIEHNLIPQDILGRSQANSFVEARHKAMWRARKMRPDLSLQQLGRIFDRDHTVIVHACQKMERRQKAETT